MSDEERDEFREEEEARQQRAAQPITLDRIAKAFIKMRDARSVAKREWEAADRKIEEQMDVLENFMLEQLRNIGADSVKTKHGTVFKSVDITPQGTDWNAFYAWVAEENAFDALEKRIKKTFVANYMEANDGELPPGVSVFRQNKVTVRRNNKE